MWLQVVANYGGQRAKVACFCCVYFSADVVLTDLPEFVDLMTSNIETNSQILRGRVQAKALKW